VTAAADPRAGYAPANSQSVPGMSESHAEFAPANSQSVPGVSESHAEFAPANSQSVPGGTPGTLVVKLGGTTIADQGHVLDQVASVARSRPVVVVHGGGKRVTGWLERLGVPTRFEDGLRVTDEASLEVTAAVLRGVINTEVVAALRARGCDAIGLSGVDAGILAGERVPSKGLVARIVDVRRPVLAGLLAAGLVPVIAPLALDETGTVCNVNADDAAAGLARGLRASHLVLLTDVDGIRDADDRRIPELDSDEAERLIASGVIAGGMIPKVRTALGVVASAPETVAIVIDSCDRAALQRALDDPGFGTRVRAGSSRSSAAEPQRDAETGGGRR
jgi:acetylglutamate kinase